MKLIAKEKSTLLRKRCLKWLAAFLIVMLLFTLLSRILDSITTPSVTVKSPSISTIGHNITVDGRIEAIREESVSIVEGLRIKDVFAAEGQTVKANDLLLELDMEDLKEKLLLASNDLKKMELQKSDSASQKSVDSSNKQNDYARANEDYNMAQDRLSKAVNDAADAMNEAKQALDQFDNQSGNTGDLGEDPVLKQLEVQVNECQQTYDVANAKVEQLQDELKRMEESTQQSHESNESHESSESHEGSESNESGVGSNLNDKAALENELALAKTDCDAAMSALNEAQDALSTYKANKDQSSQMSTEEQRKQLLDDYKAKISLYEQAEQARKEGMTAAKRGIEDASKPQPSDSTQEIAQMDIDIQKMKVEKLQKLVDAKGKIKSPVDGSVTKINATSGEVTPQSPAVRLVDAAKGGRFSGTLSEEEAQLLQVGDPTLLSIGDAFDVAQTIDFLSPDNDEDGIYKIMGETVSDSASIGKNAKLKMNKDSKSYDYCIPIEALRQDGDNYYILVPEEVKTILGTSFKLTLVEVKILDKNGTAAAIEAVGIDKDTKIVTESSRNVEAGDQVRLLEP